MTQIEPTGFQSGPINWIGVGTLYAKELQRFLRVWTQTILAPVVSSLLFLAIFGLAFGGAARITWDIPFEQFLGPGLIMMAVIQNAFANSSSLLLIAKIQGNIVDLLMPPLSPGELTTAIAFAGITRGVLVAMSVGAGMAIFVPMTIHSVFWLVFFCLAGATMMSLIGLIAGLWAEKFDHLATVTNFVVLPLAFLSGTFYSIDRLPEIVQIFAHLNPVFFLIDGFRYGFLGLSDSSVWLAAAVVMALDLVLWIICQYLIAIGYKLKA